jgi:ABC-type Mn2+/Zn2+ transport system ATPase subunit
MAIIEARNVCVKLNGQVIVENVSMEVQKGEIVALIGPNGAGKSTLLKAILGLVPIDEGEVRLLDKRTNELGDLWEKVGYVPQRLSFDPTFPITVFELISLRFRGKGGFSWGAGRGSQIKERVVYALRRVGAEGLAKRKIGQLSGGEFQRALVAYSLAKDPEILFLDEPLSGVDIRGEETIYGLIAALQKSEKLTVVLVSHELNIVYRYADRVYCLNRNLFCQGPPSEILTEDNLKKAYGPSVGFYEHAGEHSHLNA